MIQELFNLDGKKILITGSSRGIGFTLSQGLGKAGATIVLNGRHSETLKRASEKLIKEDIVAHYSVFDVSDEESIKNALYKINSTLGSIDVLINNAGIIVRFPLEKFSKNDWQKIIDINLTGAFLTSKSFVSGMIKQRAGKIINICSIQSELARPTIAPYAASKGGLKMLTQGMATDWGKYNIQVNGIAPGYFKTELTKPLYQDEKFDAWLCARTPANRWGDPKELVGAAIFLASKASDYVNGHILFVDGGLRVCV